MTATPPDNPSARARAIAAARELVGLLLLLTGAAVIVYGAALLAPGLGFLTGGLLTAAVGWAMTIRRVDE